MNGAALQRALKTPSLDGIKYVATATVEFAMEGDDELLKVVTY